MSRNISDPEQVKKSELKEKDKRKQELNDLRTLLSSVSGRRFVWRVLEECNTFGSVYSKDHSVTSYLSGKQDLGHFLMSEIISADPNLMIRLMKDNNRKEK